MKQLDTIPEEETYHFKERSEELYDRLRTDLSADESCEQKQVNEGDEDDMSTETGQETEEQCYNAVLVARLQLQKGLSSGEAVRQDRLSEMSSAMHRLERLPQPSSGVKKKTKITKVLRQIKETNILPQDEKHQLADRSEALLDKWTVNEESE